MSALSEPTVGLSSRTRPLDQAPDLLEALGPDGFAWLHDGAGLATAGVAARVTVRRGAGRLADAAAEVAGLLGAISDDDPVRLPGSGPIAVGALGFSDDAEVELIVPAVVVGCTRQGQAWMTTTEPAGWRRAAASGRGGRGGEPTRFVVDGHGHRAHWTFAVDEALSRIGSGSLSKVVLARQVTVEADRDFDLATIVDRLRTAHPSCFTFAAGGLVGASPELLVRRRDTLVVSRPMAGTVGRGDTMADDNRRMARMRSSSKEGREHRVVVDAVRKAWGRCARRSRPAPSPRSPAWPPSPTWPPPWPAGCDRRHRRPSPSPACCTRHRPWRGEPRPAALAAIAELEEFDRGGYAGPVGWVDSRGDGDFAVALRCARVDGRRARLFAGAGIVAGSSAGAEWAETQAKLEPMMRALVQP